MLILTEGFDCPSLKTVFCRPSGRGCTIQMGSRVFRKHPDLPRKQIVQCKATRHPFTRTAMAEEQYVWANGHSHRLTVNREITAIGNRTRQMMLARRAGRLPEASWSSTVRGRRLGTGRDRFRFVTRKDKRKNDAHV